MAEVTLTATLNGKPLWLKRRKGARVNQLFLKHDGKDLTRQIAKWVLRWKEWAGDRKRL